MKTSTKNVIITGCFGVLGAIAGALIATKYQTDKSDTIMVTIKTEKDELLSENTDLQKAYDTLLNDYSELERLNASLVAENGALNQKNKDLNKQLSQQNDELEQLKNGLNTSSEDITEIASTTNNSQKSLSIFNLDTFQGDPNWYDRTYSISDLSFIDTYDNEYLKAHIGYHRPRTLENNVPTYLLDYKYSTCEGQIAWSKVDKDEDGSVWIDFYADNTLIYSTDPITATDRIQTFSFSLEGYETLTIVRNGSSEKEIAIIYPYLNLIKK